MTSLYLGPYLNFQGRARQAMEFYHRVLGGTLELYSLTEEGEPKSAGPGDRITYARLAVDGFLLAGSDGHPDYPPREGDNIGLTLGGTDKERLRKAFDQLAEGGRVKLPLSPQRWGAEVGWLSDQFGVNWNVSVETE